MTDVELTRLLDGAARSAEAAAPAVEPLAALAAARRRRDQRRGHVVALAFVSSVVLLQLVPAEAFGASSPVRGAAVAAPAPDSSAASVPRG